MTIEFRSHSPAETVAIGEKIGRQLKGNEIIFLVGDLGAGKTLFAKGIAGALGIAPEEVVSPSFTLINEFRGKDNRRFYHLDLYRLGPSEENHLPEIDDYIGEGVMVIEWAQFLHSSYFKLKDSIKVTFKPGESETGRILEIDTL